MEAGAGSELPVLPRQEDENWGRSLEFAVYIVLRLLKCDDGPKEVTKF